MTLLKYDAEAQCWAVELSDGSSIRVRPPNLALLSRGDCPPSLRTRHIGESVGPRVVEARREEGRVCWTTCGECACQRGFSFRQWADRISSVGHV
jgi:hypothetical protein